jgi:hypothetical protein
MLKRLPGKWWSFIVSPFKKRPGKWRFIAFVGLFIVLIFWVLVSLVFYPIQDPTLLGGFRGNTISGIIVGFMFLFLALYLGAGIETIQKETHELVRRIDEIQQRTHELVSRQSDDEEDRKKIRAFENFLSSESYHDAIFPDLKTELHGLGLNYRIIPVRDANGPRRHVTEMEIFYVVRVDSVSYRDQLGPEELLEYDAAPIRTGEFYFCRFYNHSWHMGLTTMGVGWQPFYLGGKVGPVEHGIKANDFANASVNPPNSQLLSTLLLNADGRLKPEYEGGGCSKVEIFKSEREIFIRINDSPPKSFYMKHDLYDRPKGPVVDNLEGYFPGPARARFMERILAEIKRLGEQLPKKIVDDDG